MAGLCEGDNEPPGSLKASKFVANDSGYRTLRRSEEKRLEALEMWRRMERVKWTDRIRNETVLERVDEERMMLIVIRKKIKELVGSLSEKKLPTERCNKRNGEREKSSGQKKISDDRRY
ncbi:hypothetical protein ANN_15782 [Periplaneta americana]|uniref:Uncharacterized protein n=1 Tax=Periplaneta americana TaxID=6978 RepID=A0ABQ8SH69_PERAM|nr:hypothetical protein ANN_15782 [Periplaneta americana]